MPDENEEIFAVDLARESVLHFLSQKRYLPLPSEIPLPFQEKAGVFVTLKKRGELRGCIGTISPLASCAAEEIVRNAVSSATRDPRFSPVILEEMRQISFSVDLLRKPETIQSTAELNPKIYGVIVKSTGRSGLLLPDIEGVESVEQQIAIARQKAGILPWEEIKIERFEVVRYGKK